MGRFSYEDADKYGGGSGGKYLSLKQDGERARVHLLGNDMGDFDGYACHDVTINGAHKWVNCLRNYNDPIDVCPFCAKKMPVKAKLFIPLFNIDTNEVQVWERGKQFFRTLSSYCSRNPHVVSVVTEIERQGKANDTSTTYGLYKIDDTDKTMDDFRDMMPRILGDYILDKSADEMKYYLDHKAFPGDDNNDEPIRRRSSSDRDRDRDDDRRTYSRRDRSAEDDY